MTCQKCGASIVLAPSIKKKYPHWVPKLCRYCLKHPMKEAVIKYTKPVKQAPTERDLYEFPQLHHK